jgi:hypothetical protein
MIFKKEKTYCKNCGRKKKIAKYNKMEICCIREDYYNIYSGIKRYSETWYDRNSLNKNGNCCYFIKKSKGEK